MYKEIVSSCNCFMDKSKKQKCYAGKRENAFWREDCVKSVMGQIIDKYNNRMVDLKEIVFVIKSIINGKVKEK